MVPDKRGRCSSFNAAQQKASCSAVYKYLTAQAKNTSTYATNPLWQIVSGPFRLKAYSAGGTQVVMVPNTKYSGLPKPKIKELRLVTFTSDAAQYNVLRAGKTLTVGYLPLQSAPQKLPNQAKPPTNPVSGYDLQAPVKGLSWNFMMWNYNNPTTGPVVHQLYFRQAFQSVIDQNTYVKVAMRGYGYPEYGPNPPSQTQYVTKYQKSIPYPFDIAKAKTLLTSHGWTIPSSGPATCTRPGTGSNQCGEGVAQGTSLEFDLKYSAGTSYVDLEMAALKSDASKAGIVVNVQAIPGGELGSYFAPCKSTEPACKWQMLFSGPAFTNSGTFYPETSVVFKTGAVFNVSNYSNATIDGLYKRVFTKPGDTALLASEDYIARTVAVPLMPVNTKNIYEVSPKLKGFVPSPILSFEPENWYFVN